MVGLYFPFLFQFLKMLDFLTILFGNSAKLVYSLANHLPVRKKFKKHKTFKSTSAIFKSFIDLLHLRKHYSNLFHPLRRHESVGAVSVSQEIGKFLHIWNIDFSCQYEDLNEYPCYAWLKRLSHNECRQMASHQCESVCDSQDEAIIMKIILNSSNRNRWKD